MALRVELVTTDGIFSLDGEDYDVSNNVWMIGDDKRVVVIDAAHDAAPIQDAIGGRAVTAVFCTHGHNDHINAAAALADAHDAPIWLHPADRMLWDAVYPDRAPDRDISERTPLSVGAEELAVLHTPGHTPGCCCFYATAGILGDGPMVFSGDTLFCGGPGATGRSFSDPDLILYSIQDRLLTLPAHTVVHTGHGQDTTIGAETDFIRSLVVERAAKRES